MIENFWCFVLFLPHVQVVGCERLTLNVPEVQQRLHNPPQARGEHSELWPVMLNFQHLLPANDEPSLRICCSWAALVQQLSCRWRPVERHSVSSLALFGVLFLLPCSQCIAISYPSCTCAAALFNDGLNTQRQMDGNCEWRDSLWVMWPCWSLNWLDIERVHACCPERPCNTNGWR